MKGLFVTGTDTGVGKTFISLTLVSAWRDAGLRVGVMKPCETGCEASGGVPADADLLLRESRTALSLDEVCPFRHGLPIDPAEAAAVEQSSGSLSTGGVFSLERALEIFRTIRSNHDVTVVEGAGGLLAPYAEACLASDMALAMGLPLLVTARIGHGTINHTGLTVRAARAAGIEVLGVVFTRTDDPGLVRPGPDEIRNPDAVACLFDVPVLGNVPYIPGRDHLEAREFMDAGRILDLL
jgi:dethiobiotin synthetase